MREAVGSSPVVIADGHHRYETARTYRRESPEPAPAAIPDGADLVMALVVELAEDQLAVGPIHRGLSGLPDGLDLVDAFSSWFDVTRAGDFDERTTGALGRVGRLALVMPSGAWLLSPKDGTPEAAGADLDSSMVALVIAELPDHELEFFHCWQDAIERWPPSRPRPSSCSGRSRVEQIAEWARAGSACRRRAPTSTPSRGPAWSSAPSTSRPRAGPGRPVPTRPVAVRGRFQVDRFPGSGHYPGVPAGAPWQTIPDEGEQGTRRRSAGMGRPGGLVLVAMRLLRAVIGARGRPPASRPQPAPPTTTVALRPPPARPSATPDHGAGAGTARPGMDRPADHAAPGRRVHLALVHLGHVLRRRRRRDRRGRLGAHHRGRRHRVVGRGVVVRTVRLLPGPGHGPVTRTGAARHLAARPGPSCVIVDGSGHVSTGDGTNWSTPDAHARRPSTAGQPGRPRARAHRSRGPTARVVPGADVLCRRRQHRPRLRAAKAAVGPPRSPSGRWVRRGHPRSLPGGTGRRVVPDQLRLHRGGRERPCSTGTAPRGPGAGTLDVLAHAGPSDPTAISCPTTSLCFVVNGTGVSIGQRGQAVVAPRSHRSPGGSTRSRARPPRSAWRPTPAASVLAWNGSAWSAPGPGHPGGDRVPGIGTTVSCPSPQFCMVINSDGDYATYSGSGIALRRRMTTPSHGSAPHPGHLGQGGDRAPVAGRGLAPRRRSR